jgi:hypothetical protein
MLLLLLLLGFLLLTRVQIQMGLAGEALSDAMLLHGSRLDGC